MGELPPFAVFFEAVHRGRPPLPWQERLAGLAASNDWPREIGVPTGLGKTAVLDVAVWALAVDASCDPQARRAARRTWYVVNRRLLVDAAFEHGKLLAKLLKEPGTLGHHWPEHGPEHLDALRAVASALGSLAVVGVEQGPLCVVRLRGGAELGERPPDPSQPSLLFATVPMFASRWLFRGYGSSAGMRPVDAALAGMDSLVLLDEAHLALPLVRLREPLLACDAGDPTSVLRRERAAPRFVALTATGDSRDFDLDERDLANPIVRRRLEAAKPVELRESSAKALAKDLAQAAVEATGTTTRRRCLVFVNSPANARATASALEEELRRRELEGRVLVLTGQMREREAVEVRSLLLDEVSGLPAGRDRAKEDTQKLFVVATQTLEVGADLDADVVVTETAGLRALVQRLGRCNRLGESPDPLVVICHAADNRSPLYGEEPAQAWEQLRAAPKPLSLSPGRVRDVLRGPSTLDLELPEPLPALVWEWAKTTRAPAGEAPPEAYFSPDDDVARVSVCWRAYQPEEGGELVTPVGADEAVDLRIGELSSFLRQRGLDQVRRLRPDRAALESCAPSALRPGDVVVLDPVVGGYDRLGWNPDATEPVLDVSLLDGRLLPLVRPVVDNLVPGGEERTALYQRILGLERALEDEADVDADVAALLEALRASAPHPSVTPEEWGACCERLEPRLEVLRDGTLALPRVRLSLTKLVVPRLDALEQLSFDATSRALFEHLESVGELARRIADRLGLPEALCATVEHAGRTHDLGKLDGRFQRWLDPDGEASEPLAKSGVSLAAAERARVQAGWPRGGRHEATSARLVAAWLERAGLPHVDRDLVVHLVVAHHGQGRPLVATVADAEPEEVEATLGGISVRTTSAIGDVDWEQPRRFRSLCERYGYWGLALLEAIVRQADHLASQAVVA